MLLGRFLRVLGLVVGCSLFPSISNAQTSKLSASGASAQGFWEQFDGCIRTNVSVFGTDDALNEAGAGGPETKIVLSASISTLNSCAGTFTSVGSNGTGEFTMTALNEAHLRGTLPAFTFKGRTRVPAGEITIDVTFVASGDVQRTFFISRRSFGNDFRSTARGTSRLRQATITGSVMLNGVDALTGAPGAGHISTGTQASFQQGF